MEHGLAVPTDGLSLAALRAFVAEHSAEGRTFAPAPCEAADARSLPLSELTTTQVCDRIIKPATAERRCAYSTLLAGRSDAAGRPLVAKATVFVSHAWSYRFLDLVDTIVAQYPEGADAGVYLWNGAWQQAGLRMCPRG